jgi:low affinity Fe/Cu permease
MTVDVLTEEEQPDEDGHQRLGHGQGGERQSQRSGVKGALGEQQGASPPDDEGIGLPGAQGVDDATVEQMSGPFGEGGHIAEGRARPRPQEDGGPAARPPAGPGQHDGAGGGDSDGEPGPVLPRRHRATESGMGHPQEQGQSGRDENSGTDVGGGDPSVIEPRRHRQGEDQAEDEERLDEEEGSSTKGQELKEITDAVEGVAHQPHGSPDQTDEESYPDRELRRLAHGGVVLEDRSQPVGGGTDDGQHDDRDEIAPDVVVEDAQTPTRERVHADSIPQFPPNLTLYSAGNTKRLDRLAESGFDLRSARRARCPGPGTFRLGRARKRPVATMHDGHDGSMSEGEQAHKRRTRRRIRHRTAHLPAASRVLYRIEHYSSMAGVAVTIALFLVALIVAGAILGFRTGWVVGFEVTTSSITLLMVFVIQHTQGREQAATQRKLDEMLRAIPGAAESLMMLEEAPQEFLLMVEEDQRDARSDSIGDASVGDDAVGDDAAGDDAAGDDAAGDDAAGDNAVGDNAAGDEAADDDPPDDSSRPW